MLTTRYTTIENILEIVYNDFGFNVKRSEAARWIWEVIGYMGIPYGLEEKIINSSENELYTVEDYRCPIPTDCYKIEGIKHKSLNVGLKRATGIYHINKLIEGSVTTNDSLTVEGENVVENDTELDFDTTVYVTGTANVLNKEALTYREHEEHIYFGFKSGDIVIAYTAFPVDQYGYPKVPDDAKYIRAVVRYIAKQYAFRLKLKNKISRDDYTEICNLYYFAVGAARTKAHTPDADFMETMKQMYVRLTPLPFRHASGFETTSDRSYSSFNLESREVEE